MTAGMRVGGAGGKAGAVLRSPWRGDFPLLSQPGLAYLDSAATSQKPRAVIEAVERWYAAQNANIHRGVYRLSEEATAAYESSRARAARFINAADVSEVIFTSGTTGSVNLVAQSWGRASLQPGDEILVTEMEHHSNLVPWQLVAAATGARVVPGPVTETGELNLDGIAARLSARTRLVAVAHVSNALGTVNPVAEVTALAQRAGALVLVDGAQSAPHMRVDVQALGCDFFACSGHKMLGPTGIGLLYGRRELLGSMPPWQGGGDMIDRVSFAGTTFAPPPARFEAGTPNLAGAVGLGAAIDYLEAVGLDQVAAHEAELLEYALGRLPEVPGLRVIGAPRHRAGVISFVMDGVHPHDIGTVLDSAGVAVRAGHHCAQPLMRRLGVPATARMSVAVYNDSSDLDALIAGLHRVRELFG